MRVASLVRPDIFAQQRAAALSHIQIAQPATLSPLATTPIRCQPFIELTLAGKVARRWARYLVALAGDGRHPGKSVLAGRSYLHRPSRAFNLDHDQSICHRVACR